MGNKATDRKATDWAAVELDYGDPAITDEEIATRHGITKPALLRHASRAGWAYRRPNSRTTPRAVMELNRLAAATRQRLGKMLATDKTDDVAAISQLLSRLVQIQERIMVMERALKREAPSTDVEATDEADQAILDRYVENRLRDEARLREADAA